MKQSRHSSFKHLSLLLLVLVFVLSGAEANAQENDPLPVISAGDFYGINFIAPYEPWLSLANESGVGVVRWQFNWRDHEPAPGQWTWQASEGPIQAWNNAGIKVDAILHFPPDWAIKNPGPHGTPPWIFDALMPRNIELSWSNPENGWAKYCHEFANHYRGQINSYEIWNEPDLDNYWDGSPRDYFYLMRSCYMGIKAADPDVTVAMSGMALVIEKDFYPEVVRLAATDPAGPENNFFFDVANIHMYGDPDHAYDLTVQTRDILEQYGLEDKPIWITETNVALRGYGNVPDEPRWGYATEEEAAWFMLQVASSAHAARAERLMFFRLSDDGMDQAFGLTRGDGSPRPAYEALQLATSFMHSIVEAEREERNGVIINTLHRADGARIIVAYSKVGQPVSIDIPAETDVAVLVNPVGGYAPLEPDLDGNYVLNLLPARNRDFGQIENYSVGGPPLMIVEFEQAPPVTSVEVLPSSDDPGMVLVRWEGDDGEYGTGIAHYDIEVRRDSGEWEEWLTETTELDAAYDISEGGIFSFRVRATDRAGNTGEFSEEGEARLIATLLARVVDLRGQSVPYARVQLADGSLHDADANGIVQIEAQAGTLEISGVDGGVHGTAAPPPVNLNYAEITAVTWTLEPINSLIINGEFDQGSLGWEWHEPGDVDVLSTETEAVLQLGGHRRAWGSPGVSTTIDVPGDMFDAVLAFRYRMPESEQTLRVRVVSGQTQDTLWVSNALTPAFKRVALHMGQYAGQKITLYFELWGAKDVTSSDGVEIDSVRLGSIPVLNSSN